MIPSRLVFFRLSVVGLMGQKLKQRGPECVCQLLEFTAGQLIVTQGLCLDPEPCIGHPKDD